MREQTPAGGAKGPRRRSTRIAQQVPVLVTWVDSGGKTRSEQTSTTSINCHGCKYFSVSRLRKNTRVTLEVGSVPPGSGPLKRPIHARVRWQKKSFRLPGLYHVGIEFETPQDIWQVREPPKDWGAFPAPGDRETDSFPAEVERLLQLESEGTLYELLGVRFETPRAEIKRRFYQLAQRFHPDHNTDRPAMTPRLEAVMDLLNLAYKTLSNEESKKQYDLQLAQPGIPRAIPAGLTGQTLVARYIESARACLKARNYVGSILWMRRAVEVEPSSSTYRAMLAVSLIQVPEYRREALEQFEIATQIDPRNVAAHYQYAQALETMKLPWRARLHYRRALEIDPQHKQARERLMQLDVLGPHTRSRHSLLDRLTGRHRE